jgi:hypothetical protein
LPYFENQENFQGKLLGGWQISGIVYYFTGLGFSPSSSIDPSGLGLLGSSPSGARPNVTCNPNTNSTHSFDQLWFTTTCFSNAVAPSNAIGNSSRNIIQGPSTTRFDATLAKNIRFSESKSIQLRWEVFNVFNHTNFTTFSSLSVTSSVFGRIGGVRDPRQMQLGIKFLF